MNRRWIILIIAVVLIIVVLVILYFTGYLSNLSWQKLTMYFALGSGPAKLAYSKLLEENPNFVKEMLDDHKDTIEKDKVEREKLDKEIARKKAELKKIDKDIEQINTKLVVIEEKKKTIAAEVSTMTVEEKKTDFKEMFGE